MPTQAFVTVDVFTDRRFGGNPLAVFTDASGLSDAEMQALAAEFNYSETTFVLSPDDPAHTARVRIFTPRHELPFAGHPNVGTGFVLARAGRAGQLPFGKTAGHMGDLVFEEIAGLVGVTIDRDPRGLVTGATIAAPRSLTLEPGLPAAQVAACAGLDPADILVGAHPPIFASVGIPFLIAETDPGALIRAAPDLAAFRDLDPTLSLHLYARAGAGRLRARMFAPLSGIVEDPATGSANAALAALLLSLTDRTDASFEITQGVEMGRPSLLHAAARRTPEGIRATIGGSCVPVLRGETIL